MHKGSGSGSEGAGGGAGEVYVEQIVGDTMEAWVASAMSWLAGLLGRYKGRRRWSREEVAQMVATLERLQKWAEPYPEMWVGLLEVIRCLQEGRWADAKRGFLVCWGYYMALREMEARAREQAEEE